MKTVWINKVRKREVKSGYKILSLEIPTMKSLDKQQSEKPGFMRVSGLNKP